MLFIPETSHTDLSINIQLYMRAHPLTSYKCYSTCSAHAYVPLLPYTWLRASLVQTNGLGRFEITPFRWKLNQDVGHKKIQSTCKLFTWKMQPYKCSLSAGVLLVMAICSRHQPYQLIGVHVHISSSSPDKVTHNQGAINYSLLVNMPALLGKLTPCTYIQLGDIFYNQLVCTVCCK